MKRFFDYCFYRIAKVYRILDKKDYCDWGYGVMFATFGFIALALITCILYVLKYKLTNVIIIAVATPFILLDVLFTFFFNKESKYMRLEKYYKNEKNRRLKGWLVFLYVFGSVALFFISLLLCV